MRKDLGVSYTWDLVTKLHSSNSAITYMLRYEVQRKIEGWPPEGGYRKAKLYGTTIIYIYMYNVWNLTKQENDEMKRKKMVFAWLECKNVISYPLDIECDNYLDDAESHKERWEIHSNPEK